MTDRYSEYLSAWLDDELPPDLHTEVAEHLEGCAGCRGTLEELKQVVARAQALASDQSGRDQWQSIAALIQKPAIGGAAVKRRVAMSWPQLAAAAMVLIALGAAIPFVIVPRPKRQVAQVTPSVPSAASPSLTEPHALPAGLVASKDYDSAVQDLQTILTEHRSKLDSTTVKVLEKSLAKIDRAITDAETALKSDPGNAYLSGHLARTRLRKLDLLRHAAALSAVRS